MIYSRIDDYLSEEDPKSAILELAEQLDDLKEEIGELKNELLKTKR
jgi:rubrerythrin